MKYEVTVHGTTRAVSVASVRPGVYRLSWEEDGALQEHTVDVYRPSPEAFQMLIDGESWEVGCVPHAQDSGSDAGYLVDVVGVSAVVGVVDPRRKALRISGSSGSGMISTSMPGRIVRLMGAVGDRVTKGQPVIVVEAMKMENELKSPVDGIIEEILVAPGQAVEAGAKLLRVG